MRMLRCMMRIKRIEKIWNEGITARADMANISEKIRETRLKWIGYRRERLKKM